MSNFENSNEKLNVFLYVQIGWNEKIFEIEKVLLQNPHKYPKISKYFDFGGLATTPNLFRRAKITSKGHNSQTTHPRDLVFGSKFAELPGFYNCLRIFCLYHKKVTVYDPIFCSYSGKKSVKTSVFL